ncbi:hypothetical protein MTR67_052303 [Solanum verrucosum]|uniref:Uncharacterized protein n=1 Tax=Solanum verrucosum TaxID=315347 RepID=A0AAF0V901_SOLVR|nr:hypothetical protein MTR67_052303 [Solanum verrucosum]
MMSQMELLKKQFVGSISENKEVEKLSRLDEGSCPGYLRSDENQGWNTLSEDGWKSYNHDLADQNNFWRREDGYEAYYMHMGDSPRSRDSSGSLQ